MIMIQGSDQSYFVNLSWN